MADGTTAPTCSCSKLVEDLIADRARLLEHAGCTEAEWVARGGLRLAPLLDDQLQRTELSLVPLLRDGAILGDAPPSEAEEVIPPLPPEAALLPPLVPIAVEVPAPVAPEEIPPLPLEVVLPREEVAVEPTVNPSASAANPSAQAEGGVPVGLFAAVAEAPRVRVTPTEEQQIALGAIDAWYAGNEDFFALTGPAGTGKSTLLREVVDLYDPVLTAMTGKAALRLEQVTGAAATTLHKVLYWPPKPGEDVRFDRLRDPPEPGRILVVDEASMMGPSVFAHLKRWGVRALFVGDSYQLPPVITEKKELEQWGEDYSVFAQVSGVALKTVMRNAGGVLRAATRVRETGSLYRASDLDGPGSGYEYLSCGNPIERAVEEYLADREDNALITWKNAVRMHVNRAVRERLGHDGPLPDAGEPVLVRKNGQGHLNGEIVTCGGFVSGPRAGSMRTLWMSVANGAPGERLLVSVDGGSPGRGGEFFDGGQPWVEDWKKYLIDLKNQMLPEPIPLTWGYCGTAHTCVHPETIVETPRGLFRMRRLASTGQIATPTGVKPYDNFVTNPSSVMLRIRTKDGYTLDVTPDHGIFVWDGEAYSRIETCDARPGLKLQFRLGTTCDPTDLKTLPRADSHSDGTLDTRALAHRIPEVVSEDVAEFFGMMVADGTLFDRGFRLVKRHRDVVLRFKHLAETIFHAQVHDEMSLDYGDADVTGANVQSVQIARWLARLGGMSPKLKDVPECVLESPLRVQAHFLRGLFEDGTVNIAKDTGCVDHIEWSTCRESLATTVHVMLLRFGIIAMRGVREPYENALSEGEQHTIYIYGINARRFRDAIGFISAWKQDRLVERGGDAKETRYKAPFSRSEIEVVRPFLSRSDRSNWCARGDLSRNAMRSAIARGASGSALSLLEEKLKWHHSEIVSIDRVEDAPSMCVRVPDGKRFLQNGSPQSNCQGSEARRATVFLDRGDDRMRYFNKETTLPGGDKVLYSARWCYTAQTRSRVYTKMIVG